MHLIVDSGSTKSDWVLLNGSSKKSFHTMGLNPYFHNEKTVYEAIEKNDELFAHRHSVTNLFFYGAGCSSAELNQIIHGGLSRAFTNAEIVVDHDLMACAYATYENEPSISCILGTGSNSCFFDGENLIEEVPALGYILGDEGSGAYFGKKLVSSYLYHKLPEHISMALEQEMQLTKDEIVRRVYMEKDANVYLASFMKFIVQYAEDDFIKKMIYNGFKEFVEVHVCCYQNYKSYKVHFIGSIAFLFKDQLSEACSFYEAQMGQVIRKPIDGLISYHLNKISKEST
jgi:glucosamine kinase